MRETRRQSPAEHDDPRVGYAHSLVVSGWAIALTPLLAASSATLTGTTLVFESLTANNTTQLLLVLAVPVGAAIAGAGAIARAALPSSAKNGCEGTHPSQ